MAASGSSLWPTLTSPDTGMAESMETKFDWLEANILPMLAGSTTDAAYDLGAAGALWANAYTNAIRGTTLNFYASATTAVIINSNGIVDMPTQSYARAYRDTTRQALVAGNQTVLFNTKSYDSRAEYTTTTGLFTALSAGKYYVTSCVRVIANSVANRYALGIGTTSGANGSLAVNNSMVPYGSDASIYVSGIINVAAAGVLRINMNVTVGSETSRAVETLSSNSFLAIHKVA